MAVAVEGRRLETADAETGEPLCQYCGEEPGEERLGAWTDFDRLCAGCAYWQLAELAEKVAGNLVTLAYDRRYRRSRSRVLRCAQTLLDLAEQLVEEVPEG